MKLIVGLGNPGATYENTRHNVGFMAVDSFAKQRNLDFKLDKNLKSMISTFNHKGNKVIIIKPVTYMNLSGEAVSSVMRFYNMSTQDIVVINDDLDLPCGNVRIRERGSAGGHNGLKSINQHLKTEEYKRIKVGIDRSKVIPVVDYVLGRFTPDEAISIDLALNKVSKALEAFIDGVDYQHISSVLNM